jgi:phosphoribosyl 1,2-cyclic phosphodiesterase
MALEVRFWGVRGSIACPSPKHVAYGGNTSCLEVIAGDRVFVLDAGTGIRGLGSDFTARGILDAEILLTHTHWDHINGFPFFSPAYDARRSYRIMAGHLADQGGVRAVFVGQMATPMFPVPLETMRAKLVFEDFRAGDAFELGEVKIRTTLLNHPNGATGYRIEHGGKSFCYVTDTEHVIGRPDENVLRLIDGADLVVYDSTYTDDEFPTKIGWGHSTWQEGIRLCRRAAAKRLAIFHHDPDKEDPRMDQIAKEAADTWDGSFVAREGMRIVVG